MEIERLLKIKAENEVEKLCMILSNNADYCSEDGLMLSVKQFEKTAEDIMLWRLSLLKNNSEVKNFISYLIHKMDKLATDCEVTALKFEKSEMHSSKTGNLGMAHAYKSIKIFLESEM